MYRIWKRDKPLDSKYNTFYLFVSTLFMYYKHDQNMYVFGHATNVNN